MVPTLATLLLSVVEKVGGDSGFDSCFLIVKGNDGWLVLGGAMTYVVNSGWGWLRVCKIGVSSVPRLEFLTFQADTGIFRCFYAGIRMVPVTGIQNMSERTSRVLFHAHHQVVSSLHSSHAAMSPTQKFFSW